VFVDLCCWQYALLLRLPVRRLVRALDLASDLAAALVLVRLALELALALLLFAPAQVALVLAPLVRQVAQCGGR
jgi:hypothetical protein